MKGIYIAAIITTALSLTIVGSIILRKTPRKEWSLLIVVLLLQIPMCAIAFYFIRLPLDRWLQGLLRQCSGTYRFLTTFYAPITEEPIKLWIFLIPKYINNLNDKNIVRMAMAIGLGFGIGEMWFIAANLAKSPQVASLPWFLLGGYISERFMVCLMHGAFTAVALRQLRKAFVVGVLGAMLLHFVGNFPIFLAGNNFGGLGKSTWQIILSVWVPLYFLAMVALLAYFTKSKDAKKVRDGF